MALKLISLLLAQVALARLGQNASVLNRSNATSKDANVPLGEGSALEIMVNGTRHGLRGEKAASDLYANDTDARSMAGRYAGYQTFATTTRYGDADAAACGGMHTGSLVGGLPYYSVASAQSMWKGCCWCGHSGGGQGTHGLGCFSCAKGRFLRSAYGLRSPDNAQRHGFASGEIIIVVADLCPHQGNERWCPERPGQHNNYGAHNHLDFSHPPPGIDNNNFVFTPIQCPYDLQERYHHLSRCHN
ncbi:unnamed protein product [Effrenium voratum]|uniref:Uncharacterized protein n=1 Tax=Effrenium voratum TaxID=2562239 RepID=A0AA36HRA1_9DINO|nr:unnamed protein product [Effrenium voratum]CAJ1373827.1 unnamed protein product [Effrenium voratum]CAJ1437987.1 unnamed protein product [Effrenium voratum]|mmetsp:Transcript_134756/g.319414  ORF Transcript_134756/g.319414 Transcript_134756/m.319414 type:complete len:245 (-) Transcript_134756:318-1052(-)|eukprot:CAMPEP_0181434396 /NCGR_PEP_ID=MMETSP1110-20121109/19797_1 /TAXON_ID=174948 /ORGANISM="Symbiodinium sp., Strain CCMP421" /LENGTH=244 /DNA_ID=CAMNT_0023557901 /DNA_START=64 /DNA_END=798 /DNA_ORIENTATION=-